MSEVSMFVPCSADLLLPEIGEAMFHLLRRLGKKPVYHEEQTCCGQPAVSAGYRGPAREAAKHFIEVFENDSVIVCPSGSCIHTVKHDYPRLLQDEAGWLKRAEKVASNIYELSEYLVDVLAAEDVGAVFEGKVAFHESCKNLRSLGISAQPKKVIQAVKGTELVPLNGAEVCCGFGGEFSFGFPEISEAMVKDKTDNFIASGADLLVLSEPGCLLNVAGYLKRHHPDRKAVHLVNFLVDNQEGGP
ncbi:MAG: (Fe-S)-binding protein [Proteobacteria bacterium]|nr:(Fe-S)-binding protein [Pseudomonadota bacterium]